MDEIGIDSNLVRLVILGKPDILEKVLVWLYLQGDQFLLEENVKKIND